MERYGQEAAGNPSTGARWVMCMQGTLLQSGMQARHAGVKIAAAAAAALRLKTL
jgi:hypothetical protein